ncbi:hypothetical protein ACIBM3_31105 [Rhodococcus erythropolis]|uniref:hypothetical protein n=1 Tax=Rhodococcus erythropolis TaxID=1833 RepID=UPI0037A3A5EC
MTIERLHRELRDGTRPLSEVVFGMSSGALASPASVGLPSERWAWLADLLTHPDWGMTAVANGIESVCAPVARLCQLTASAIHPLGLRELWSAEQLPAIELIALHTPGASGHWEALNCALEIITDGLDHVDGLDVSGSEAVASAFTAIINAQDADTARVNITAAVEHWAKPAEAVAPNLIAQFGVAS